jgi:hypothetical protein
MQPCIAPRFQIVYSATLGGKGKNLLRSWDSAVILLNSGLNSTRLRHLDSATGLLVLPRG